MVERKVGFGIDLMPGVAQLRQQFSTIRQISQQSMLQIQQAQERHVQRMAELRNRLSKIDNDAIVSNVTAHRRAVQTIEQEEQRHQLRMMHMQERAQLSQMGGGGKFGLAAGGHIAQALGFYRFGHLMRGIQSVGIGADVGIGTLAAAAVPVAGAFAALAVTAKVLEAGFDAAKDTIQAFVGGVSQIGGARSLQEMVAESADTQRRTALSRLTVSPEERMTNAQMEDLASGLSARADLGGFDRQKWIQAVTEMGTVTGRQKSFDRQSWEFIGRVANIGGMDPAEAAKIYGTLAYTNPQMNNAQVQQLLLSGIGIGRELTFNVAEIPSAGRVVQSASRIGGNRQMATAEAFTLAGLMKPFAASGTLGEAGTMEEALLRQMARASNAGVGQIQTNRLGQVTNLNKALGWMLSTPERQLPKALLERESGEAIHALKAKLGIAETDTPTQIQHKVDEMLEKYTKLGLSMDQLTHESEEATGVTQKIRARFNELTNDMESRLLRLLESDAFQRAFDNIIDFLTANAPTLEVAIESIMEAFNILAPALWTLTETVIDILASFAKSSIFLALAAPNLVTQIDDLSKSFAAASQQHKLREQFANVVYPADFAGPLPPGARRETGHIENPASPAAVTQAQTNDHLADIKNFHQKQIDVLHAIRQNTMPGNVASPNRSPHGQ